VLRERPDADPAACPIKTLQALLRLRWRFDDLRSSLSRAPLPTGISSLVEALAAVREDSVGLAEEDVAPAEVRGEPPAPL
jgi:hypothetical protein